MRCCLDSSELMDGCVVDKAFHICCFMILVSPRCLVLEIVKNSTLLLVCVSVLSEWV